MTSGDEFGAKASWLSKGVTALLSCGVLLLSAVPSAAQLVSVEVFASQAEFQASALYAHVQSLPGGFPAHTPFACNLIQQGSSMVPPSSAGSLNNTIVSAEIDVALLGAPTVFSGASDFLSYLKQYVSLGNEAGAGPTAEVHVALPVVPTGGTGGYNGYDIAIFDIGQNLLPETGRKNSERADYYVELVSDGTPHYVGQLTNTGGDFINVILLDLNGIVGIPAFIDEVHVVDAPGTANPRLESVDIDGIVRLNYDPATQVEFSTWGRIKAIHR
jgi:hypothetical protein